MTTLATIPRPLETTYNGYRFRSRLEARWAVFFDHLHIPYEYEKQGYDLGAAGWYLPDFWLPTNGCWLEVKGCSDRELGSHPDIAKASGLAAQHRPVLFVGEIGGQVMWLVTPTKLVDASRVDPPVRLRVDLGVNGNAALADGWGIRATCPEDALCSGAYAACHGDGTRLPWLIPLPLPAWPGQPGPGIREAIEKARSARF